MSGPQSKSVRLDVWLWRARFFKTRALASAHVAGRGVRIARHGKVRRVDKPGTSLLAGDILTFAKAGRIHSVEVVAVGMRRGPAAEARQLYRPVEESSCSTP